jgi:hypothetical protein
MKNGWIWFVLIVVFFGAFWGYWQYLILTDPTFRAEYEAKKEYNQSEAGMAERDAENEALSQKIFPYAVGAMVLFIVLIFAGDVIRAIGKPLLVLIFFMSVIGVVIYFAGWADKNNDGVADPAAAAMIQPEGIDPERDAAYADVNDNNAEANLKQYMGIGFFAVLLVICVAILGFVAQFFPNKHPLE